MPARRLHCGSEIARARARGPTAASAQPPAHPLARCARARASAMPMRARARRHVWRAHDARLARSYVARSPPTPAARTLPERSLCAHPHATAAPTAPPPLHAPPVRPLHMRNVRSAPVPPALSAQIARPQSAHRTCGAHARQPMPAREARAHGALPGTTRSFAVRGCRHGSWNRTLDVHRSPVDDLRLHEAPIRRLRRVERDIPEATRAAVRLPHGNAVLGIAANSSAPPRHTHSAECRLFACRRSPPHATATPQQGRALQQQPSLATLLSDTSARARTPGSGFRSSPLLGFDRQLQRAAATHMRFCLMGRSLAGKGGHENTARSSRREERQ